MRFIFLRISFFVFALLPFAYAEGKIDARKIYVVANTDVAGSSELATEYCSIRGIPEKNIIALPMPKKGMISRAEYYEKIETPILDKLSECGALSAQKLGAENSDGKTERIFISHDVDFVVLSFGVPWGILPSNGLNDAGRGATIKSDAASVDSELSAVFMPQKTAGGFVKNPAFGKSNPDIFKSFGMLRVARLDGANAAEARSALYGAIETEAKGLRGRAYIDKSKKIPAGDKWLDTCAERLKSLGFDTDVEANPALFGFTRRMDYPAFYFGWYSPIPVGYFSIDDFSLSKGATAMHIYSFSARNLRGTRKSAWTSGLVSDGASFTTGNVFEPFLHLTHHFDMLMVGLLSGMSAGEAAYFSLPSLSWQDVLVGDPLYAPLKKTLDSQLADIDAGRVDEVSQYVVIRKMNLMKKGEYAAQAMSYGASYTSRLPNVVALYWKLSKMSEETGDKVFARNFAEEAARRIEPERPNWTGLAFEIATYFAGQNDAKATTLALDMYERIFQMKGQTIEFKCALSDAFVIFAKRSKIDTPEKFAELSKEVAAYRETERIKREEARAKNAAGRANKTSK